MTDVLLLNASYEPLRILSVERATRLILRGRVEAASEETVRIPTSSGEWFVPRVLRLRRYVNVPKLHVKWSKRAVLRRDNWTCIYCGVRAGDLRGSRKIGAADFSVDHILPQSRGGSNTWGNTACACRECNQRKGNRTPQEAGMKLLWEPRRPRVDYLVARGEVPASWKVYVQI